MRKQVRANLEKWATNPDRQPRYPNQLLADDLHLMSDGSWRTSTEVATEFKNSLDGVRKVLMIIAKHWGYESHKKLGYRRKV
jgi:hypothetical protein